MGVLAQLAAVWIALDTGYYVLFGPGYPVHAIQITFYYLFWLALTVVSFREVYYRWRPVENRWPAYLIGGIGAIGIVAYLIFILPHFPPTAWVKSWEPPSELLFANAWYFLPKSLDILIQQLLVAAMVLLFVLHKFTLRETSLWCAGLFGGAHLLLVLGGEGVIYTTLFTLAAVGASFVFPYLLLKVKNGFLYSYFLHWIFYAVVIVLVHVVFKL